jgi:tRNA pseudouridine38/39 synthase
VDLYVRSCRKSGKGWREAARKEEEVEKSTEVEETDDPKAVKKMPKPKKEAEIEFSYPRLLNGVLPPSIRVIAWAPVDEDFNSRFSCTYRHYKYPFHLDPSLDLSQMREAAEFLVGEHDFRNFCKLDGSKQIENHGRRVVKAYFDEQEADGMVVFNLIGTAFLWHQVRHVIASLFLVGRGLEDPTLIKELLDVETNPGKPSYNMGDPLPLTLHECGYPEPLDWRIGGYDGPFTSLSESEKQHVWDKAMTGRDKLEKELIAMVQHSEYRSWQIGGGLRTLRKIMPEAEGDERNDHMISYPIGGGEVILTGKYKKVMERQRGDTPDVVNRKWREAKERRVAAGTAATGDE